MATRQKASYNKRRKQIILDEKSDDSNTNINNNSENNPKSEKKIKYKNKNKKKDMEEYDEENIPQKNMNIFPTSNIFHPELFINNLEYMERFKCGLCECICENPRFQYCGCNQVYCQKCLNFYYDYYNHKCPKCQKESKELIPSDNFKESLMNLKMRCCNYKIKCNWIGLYKDYKEHITKNCPKEIINCPNKGCIIKESREKMPFHTKNCEYRDYICRECLNKFPFIQKRTHKNVCPRTKITCPQGCGEVIEREEAPEHYKECIYSDICCPYKSLGCKDVFQRCKQKERLAQDAPAHLRLTVKMLFALKEKIINLEKTIEEMKNNNHNNNNYYYNNEVDDSNDKENEINDNEYNKNIILQNNNIIIQKKFLEKKRGFTNGLQENMFPQYNSDFSIFDEDVKDININDKSNNNSLNNQKTNEDYIYDLPKKNKRLFNINENIIETLFLDGIKHHFVFFNKKYDIPKYSPKKYSFTVKLLTSCKWLAIGICDKKIVEKNNFVYDSSNMKNGLYYMNVNSVIYNCNNIKQIIKFKCEPLSTIDTTILCTVDPHNKTMEFMINGQFLPLTEVECFEANYFSPFLLFLKNCKIQTIFNYK